MKIILSLILFTYSFNLISQECKSVETSFSVKEERAIFKGCENLGTPSAKEKCTQEKINEFIGNNIDAKIAIKQGIKGKHRVRVILKIDKFGKVSEII